MFFRGLFALAFLAWGLSTPVQAQAPLVVSTVPVNGAVDVTADTPISITFDRDMDTSVFVIGSLGNLGMVPSNLASQTQGTWSADKRTLTLKPLFGNWPINVTITWTLNPPGGIGLFPIKSTGGTALATVAGSFTTGLGAPALGLVTPENNSENVATNIGVTFRFTQVMKKIVLPGGPSAAIRWTGTGIDPAKFQYNWSVDGRSLTALYNGGFPLKTRIDWVLNPSGASVVFETATGKPLPVDAYAGGFKTTAIPTCNAASIFAAWGSYGVNKRSEFRQTSAADPVPETRGTLSPAPVIFSAVVQSPAFGGAISGGTLEMVGKSPMTLTNFGTISSYYEVLDTEAAMDAAYPPGDFTLRFPQAGQPERVVTLTQAASDLPPVPKLLNFDAAQAINPAADFALQWSAFSNAKTGDTLSIFLSNTNGQVVFQAPNVCIPLVLLPTDTSVVIPADTLAKGQTYNAELLFGKAFYFSTNTFPELYGYGYRLRATRFTVSTGAGTVPSSAAVLANGTVQPDGKPTFALQGSAGKTYAIERSDRAGGGTWTEVGTVSMDGQGKAVFVGAQVLGAGHSFYRAVSR